MAQVIMQKEQAPLQSQLQEIQIKLRFAVGLSLEILPQEALTDMELGLKMLIPIAANGYY